MIRRRTIFAKGNLDLKDTLHSTLLGGEVVWNGIGPLVRERYPNQSVRVVHETCARNDLRLWTAGIPVELAARVPSSQHHPWSSQLTSAIWELRPSAVVLSIQPDVMNVLHRHERDGYALLFDHLAALDPEARSWIASEFVSEGLARVDDAMERLGGLIDAIRARLDATVVVYGMSSVIPGETLRCSAGLPEPLSLRIRRFNVALADLSRNKAFPLVDVERVVAERGALASKVDVVHLRPAAIEAVAREAFATLDEEGLFG